jgi:hypothetical protein
MKPRFVALFLFATVVSACKGTAARIARAAPSEIVGLYERGIEPRGFRLCSDSSRFAWRGVDFAPDITTNWPYTYTNDRSRVVTLIRVRGAIGPPEKRGAIVLPGRVRVEKVLEVRAPKLGDCGWDGK